MAGIPSFAFGAGFQAKTPKEAARNRAVYEQLAARGGAPQNVGEGLNRVGEALLARSMLDRATAGEEAGQARVAELVSGFGDGADQTELMTAMSDPWLAENPAGSMVAQTLLQRELQQGDPAFQMEMEKAQLELDALRNPAMEAPEVQTIYDPTTGTEKKVQWNSSAGAWEDIGGTKANSNGLVVQTNPDGTTTVSQGGSGKPLTELQSKDNVFATRAQGALPVIDELENSLLSLGEAVGGQLPVLGNFLKSEDYQLADNAGREFLASILRKDTGAAITDSEEKQYGDIYLPRPGDKPKTIVQKRKARARALEAIKSGMLPEQVLALEKREGGNDAPETAPIQAASPLPQGVTEDDIQFTMQKHGVSREEVLKRLGYGGA